MSIRTPKALVAVIAAAALALTGCSAAETPSEPGAAANHGELALQLSFVKNSQNSGEYIADAEGFYTAEGFSKVDLIAGPTAVEASVATGKADVGFSTALTAASVIEKEKMPVKIVGAVYQKNAFTILSLEENPIREPKDLEGKRIGITAGTAKTIVEALARANDIDPAKITFVPAEGNPALLTNKDVDGYFGLDTNEKIVLEQQGVKVVSLPLADNGLPFAGTSFIVTDDAIKNDRERVKAFLKAEIKGWAAAVADPQKGVDLALKSYGSDLGLNPEKESAQGKVQLDYVYPASSESSGLFMLTPEAITANITSIGYAGVTIAADDLFDMSLLEEVYKENPELLKVKK